MTGPCVATSLVAQAPARERRAAGRFPIAGPLHARSAQSSWEEYIDSVEVANASRGGLYFTTRSAHYRVGMRVSLSLGCWPAIGRDSPVFGEVVRIDRLESSFGVAVRILMC
jgi:hypothetical protein